MYAYAQASLLQYARWMAAHERAYFEHPEKLDHPTETWVAQDMRKSEVFTFAARYSADDERVRFTELADRFHRYSTETLRGMPTRSLTRPLVLMLTNGYMHAWFKRLRAAQRTDSVADVGGFGQPERFVPQKVRAKSRLVRIGAGLFILIASITGYLIWRVLLE